MGLLLYLSALHPTVICPAGERNREVATSHALNQPHHRNGSEIPACLSSQLLSSGKKSKSQHPSSSSEIRCYLASLSHLHSCISSFHRTDLLYCELILCIISYCLY